MSEQKHDPFRPFAADDFNSGARFCIVCKESLRYGDQIVPGLTPTLGYNARAHYLCAVMGNDDYVSRDSRDHEAVPSNRTDVSDG